MIRTWLIFWHEYKGHLRRRSYLLFTFGFPIFMLFAPLIGGLILALAIQTATPEPDRRPVGLVDQAGILSPEVEPPEGPVEVIRFATAEMAAAALKAGHIQAYYDIQPHYWDSGEIVLTSEVAPAGEVEAMITGWVRQRVRAKAPPDILTRIDRGASIIHQDLGGTRAFSFENIIELALIFLPIYFVRLGSSFVAEYMFGSIASEAYDRTLEILITSVTPLQLIIGKVLGLLAVGLTQLGTWAAFALVLSVGISSFFGFDLLGALFGWPHMALLLSVLLAAYVMDQILAATLALFRVSGGAGSHLFNTINWVVGLGLLYAIYFVPRNPHSLVAVVASIFPLTASIVLLVRVVVSDVPLWQIILAQLSLWGTIFASLFWLRWLLQANLVANAAPVGLRDWLKRRYENLKLRRTGLTMTQHQ